ncbi:PREDICTED: uncharacterized protein LOC109125397 [Camelina sativa]|uniref:Uncharacterized protein LOC109125397 n=1 Tax=Camelina sativa TaxID=90675 RepID=A0ABM1Q705_CAMSA|nr:PREDICTED: uncharacterized protein LOC109125397 [Camelina sativa]
MTNTSNFYENHIFYIQLLFTNNNLTFKKRRRRGWGIKESCLIVGNVN